MDQFFPRYKTSSIKKRGNITAWKTSSLWVFLSQISALGTLAVYTLLVGRAIQQFAFLGDPTSPIAVSFRALSTTLITADEFVLTHLVGYGIAWIYLGSSLWVYHFRRSQLYTASLAIALSSSTICLVAISSLFTRGMITWLWIVALGLTSSMLVSFALRFPHNLKWSRKNSIFSLIEYSSVILSLCFIAILGLLVARNNNLPLLYLITTLYLVVFLSFIIIIFGVKLFKTNTNLEKAQIRLVLLGIVISYSPILTWILLTIRLPVIEINSLLILPLAIFPITSGYAVIHYTKTDEDRMLGRSISYPVLSGLVVIIFTVLITIACLVVINYTSTYSPFLIAFLALVLVLIINPLRNRVQEWIDGLFFKGKINYQETIQSFARDLAQTEDLTAIVTLLNQYIKKSYTPSIIHIYTYDSYRTQFHTFPGVDGQPTSDLCFQCDSSLIHALSSTKSPIKEVSKENKHNLQLSDKARLALLGADLFVALPGQNQLTGFLAIGSRQSGRPYFDEDIRFIDSLCRQASLAMERFQIISRLEQRIREMDVLTRIAQGVNITVEFDDILELIFAQTINVIPIKDFRITLRSSLDNRSYHAFYVENDERLAYNENVHIPQDHGLESIVIQNQRALIADDYLKECHQQGVVPDVDGFIAWMGVPMNAGGETIGVISLASRDPSMLFTNGHLDILQAIADHAAGAIVKSQLLAEAEKRTRQLNKLNIVARSLTSTLEINPLLKQIMTSAVEILNCEAGSLVMIDQLTDELVFEVTVGPVASDIAGIRLPAGTGVAGKVIQNGEPLITNNAAQNKDWFAQSDKETGFFTRDLLAVPMNVKGAIIGVIEVINKLDGTAFTKDDQEFLSTFTSQAAIAIENARLYTQTDNALSARVEEMSVLQRIDRDLNTTLDVDRTMKITLDWSLSQTRSEAGLIGFVEKQDPDSSKTLKVVAAKGYSADPNNQTTGSTISSSVQFKLGDNIDVNETANISLPAIQQAIQEGQPIRTEFYLEPQILEETNSVDRSNLFKPEENLLNGARSQVVVPIRRKADVIAILFLESTKVDNFPEETVTFLSRLCDHAAIAISNALLYADLQAANIAKSEFVSLVSHELKTPMTSIRGYADLLAQGTVGPINDIQANFLNTIRSNVNRMSNLVSDLADVSRIEAGRLRLDFGSTSAMSIIDEVIRSAQAQLNDKEQLLNLSIAENLPNIWGDYNRLIQIMNNLLSNAIKYTPDRGHITISAELSNHYKEIPTQMLLISVSDTGYGISPKDQEKVFSKFFRSGDPNIREVPGTGLGLNITRHLVEMQGGQIWFESSVGNGTTFHFTIPVSATE